MRNHECHGFAGAIRPRNPHDFAEQSFVQKIRFSLWTLKSVGEEEDVTDVAQNQSVKGGVPVVTVIESTNDLIDFLSVDDRLCVVKFYGKIVRFSLTFCLYGNTHGCNNVFLLQWLVISASWCKSCQKFGLKYKKLAAHYADWVDKNDSDTVLKAGKVRFAEVEFNKNAKLCRSLGIKRLPYVHFYRGAEGKLAEFSAGPSKFNLVTDKMHELLESSEEEKDFNILMNRGKDLGNYIVTKLSEEHWNQALLDEDKAKNNSSKDLNNDSNHTRKQALL